MGTSTVPECNPLDFETCAQNRHRELQMAPIKNLTSASSLQLLAVSFLFLNTHVCATCFDLSKQKYSYSAPGRNRPRVTNSLRS